MPWLKPSWRGRSTGARSSRQLSRYRSQQELLLLLLQVRRLQ